ncbi:MAG: 2OG-Fe(II) oxygenase [Myxococcales bacterium]|nr:2OG-Fe(II) oxygenase [Myxococcales bacterium]
MKPLVGVIDEVLPSAGFRRLLRAVRQVGEERLRGGYQLTCWYDFASPPSCLVEQAARVVRARLPPSSIRRVRGVEWWLSRMRTSRVQVDFHRDRDNALFDETGVEKNPVLSTVLYLNRCTGGLLAVTADPPNPDNPALAPDRHDFDLVEPRPNRLAFFDGRLTHGVLDARNHLPGAWLPRERTLRLAIAINFWASRPRGVPRYAERGIFPALDPGRRRGGPQPPGARAR